MIESAYVNISGKHIQSINAKGSINITGRSKEITREDVERAITHASAIMLPADRTVLHVLPQEYIVDSQDGIKNPVGMVGTNLDVYIHIITGSLTATKNLLLCLKKAKVNVLGTVLSHIASGRGGADPGREGTRRAFHRHRRRHHRHRRLREGIASASRGPSRYGGDNFTNDLSIGIRTAIDRAEKIKRRYGCAMDPNLKDETIEVPSVSGKKPRQISTSHPDEHSQTAGLRDLRDGQDGDRKGGAAEFDQRRGGDQRRHRAAGRHPGRGRRHFFDPGAHRLSPTASAA